MSKNRNTRAPAAPEVAPVAPTTVVAETQAPVAEVTAAPPKVTLYTVAAPKRPLTGTHFGKSGNDATHKALCDAAKQHDGKLTWEQIMEVCKEQNHKSFATYALKRLKVIQPVAEPVAA